MVDVAAGQAIGLTINLYNNIVVDVAACQAMGLSYALLLQNH
jgi:hypothetical protein